MATRRFQFEHTSGKGTAVYARVFNESGQVFDFADNQFEATLAGATTPHKTATEPDPTNLGSGRSLYGVSIDGALLNGSGQLQTFVLYFYENAAPAVGDNPISDPLQFAVRFGEFVELPVDLRAEISVRSTQGVMAQVACWLEHGGEKIDLATNGGTTFTADAGTDTITSNGHGLANGDALLLSSSTTLPGGLAAGTVYYVIGATANTFQLALSAGGAAVNITDAGTGTHRWHKPTATVVVREHGAAVATFSVGMTAADLIDGIFETHWPAGTAFTADAGTDTITSNGHGLANGQVLHLRSGGTLPGGLAEDTDYYVVGATTNTFQLALTAGGAAIDITDAGSGGTHVWTVATSLLEADRQYSLDVTIVENGVTHTDRVHRRVAIG